MIKIVKGSAVCLQLRMESRFFEKQYFSMETFEPIVFGRVGWQHSEEQ
jgi:hypothetical protein